MGVDSYKKYLSKLQAIIENECDGSRMSNTKWQELFGALIAVRQQTSFECRIKILSDDTACNWQGFLPYTNHRKADGSETIWIEPSGGPVPSVAIEYIEIKPSTLHWTGTHWTQMPNGYQNQIEQQLDALQIPYTKDGDIIRVTGHVRRPENANTYAAGNSVEA